MSLLKRAVIFGSMKPPCERRHYTRAKAGNEQLGCDGVNCLLKFGQMLYNINQ
jgi:hypothetical protein